MPSSMKSSIMDKIRILRSSRRKTTYSEKVVKSSSSPTKAPVPVVATPTTVAEPVTEPKQQWVPVLVLDISQSKNSVSGNIPVTLASSSGRSIAINKNIIVNKAVSVVNMGQHLPVSLPTETTGNTASNSECESNHTTLGSSEKVITGIESHVSPDPTNVSIDSPDDDKDTSGKQVKCVFCDKSFPTLKDMQVHYLNSHKSRRGRDNRKRKTNLDNMTMIESSPDAETTEVEKERGDLDPSIENEKSESKCPVCYIEFSTGKEVTAHMKEVHAYVCSECNETFYNLMQFTSHKCTKGTKKVRRSRKKSSGNPKTDNSKPRTNTKTNKKQNSRTKDPPEPKLKPEVAKIMNRFVQIQPKTKRTGVKGESQNSSTSPPPPLQQIVGSRSQLDPSENSIHQNQYSEVEVSKEETVDVNDSPVLVSDVAPDTNLSDRDDTKIEENNFQPAIETTYSLTSHKDTAASSIPYKEPKEKIDRIIKVIDTNNIDQAKKLVQNVEWGKGDTGKFLSKDQIQEKIAELRRNPNVSVSWRPALRTHDFPEDEEYVCGRCNVLCDDMEDYMDHLQDCLTMSSVSLEPVVSPPRRLLRLHHEIASFNSRVHGSTGMCGINRNLLSKLKEYLPVPQTENNNVHPQKTENNIIHPQKTENDIIHPQKTENNNIQPQKQSFSNIFKQQFSPTSSFQHTFKELLDDDLSCESQELETQILGPCSPHSSEIEGFMTESDERQGFMAQLPITRGLKESDNERQGFMAQLPITRVKESDERQGFMAQLPISRVKESDNDRQGFMAQLPKTRGLNKNTGARPMVMIPVSPREKLKINVIPEQVLKESKYPSSIGIKEMVREREAFTPSPVASIPLLNQDEIKMEVEEEVVQDHYEIKEENNDNVEDLWREWVGDGNGEEREENGGPTADEDEKQDGLECRLCGRHYTCLSALRGHLSRQHRVGSGYTCELCGAVGSTKAAFKRHLLRTHGPHTLAPHDFLTECRHCGEGLASLPLLYQHIRECHKDALTQYHCCKYCPVLFTTRQGLSRHYKSRHKDESPVLIPLVCRECGAELPTPAELRTHRRTEHPASSGPISSDAKAFTCDQCQTVFACRSYLTKHIKKVHQSCPRPQSYNCSECGREYRHKARLQRHIATHHPSPGHRVLYSCPTCDKTFASYDRRKSHQRRAHRDNSLWQCRECHRGFLTADELEMHRHERHKGACAVCGKVFLRRDSLREHMLIHNGPQLPCPHCPKTFTQASNLKRHIRIHTGEKPYQCTFCGKPFGDRSACNSHMRVHTGEGRCSCPTCGATFSKRQKLNYHMRLHTGEGLLHCPLCSRPATNTYDLKKHLETHQVALLTALRGSFLYADVEDLPDLALKALHNLVWVAIQNSQRGKDEENVDGEPKEEIDLSDLGKLEGLDAMERTDWSCVGVVIKEQNNSSKKGLKLINDWKKKKNGKRKKGKKAKKDADFLGIKVEKTELNDGLGGNKSTEETNDDCYEFNSDEERIKTQPRKMRLPRKCVNGSVWNEDELGESFSDSDHEEMIKCEENKEGISDSLENNTEHEKEELKSMESNGKQASSEGGEILSNIKKEPTEISAKKMGQNSVKSASSEDQILSNTEKISAKKMGKSSVKSVNSEDLILSNIKKEPTDKLSVRKMGKNRVKSAKGRVDRRNKKPIAAPLAVLTQMIQFILGSLSTPSNDNTSSDSNSTPTLGDQLVERCLEVIMQDGDGDGENDESEVIMRDGDGDGERNEENEVIMRDGDDDGEKMDENEMIMRDTDYVDGRGEEEEEKEMEEEGRNESEIRNITEKPEESDDNNDNDDDNENESNSLANSCEVTKESDGENDNEEEEEHQIKTNRDSQSDSEEEEYSRDESDLDSDESVTEDVLKSAGDKESVVKNINKMNDLSNVNESEEKLGISLTNSIAQDSSVSVV